MEKEDLAKYRAQWRPKIGWLCYRALAGACIVIVIIEPLYNMITLDFSSSVFRSIIDVNKLILLLGFSLSTMALRQYDVGKKRPGEKYLEDTYLGGTDSLSERD